MSIARVDRGGDSDNWNALVDRLQRLHLALRETPQGRAGISDLMDDDDGVTRTWAVTFALFWDEAKARRVLHAEVAQDGLSGFEAEIALREFDAGRLNTTWTPKHYSAVTLSATAGTAGQSRTCGQSLCESNSDYPA